MFYFLCRFVKTLLKKQYSISIVTADETNLIKKIFEFRYNLYCEEYKLLNKDEYLDEIETDEFDKNSVFFIAKDYQNNIVGLVRLISSSNCIFPTSEEFNLQEVVLDLCAEGNEIVEVSRFMVLPQYKETLLMIDLCRAIYIYSIENEVSFWVGCVENWFLKTLQTIYPVAVVGEPKFCFNAMNYAFIIKLIDLRKHLKNKNYFIYMALSRKSKKFKF
jgi:N-acyl-L-homoserine lactone synthetase